jgi:hypothetical protein
MTMARRLLLSTWEDTMKVRTCLLIATMAAALTVGFPGRAVAQPKAEVGGALASLIVGLDDDNDVTVFGVPSATFGIFNPGVYASFFIGTRAAVEPQLGLIVVSGSGDTMHILSASAHFDYFFSGIEATSP